MLEGVSVAYIWGVIVRNHIMKAQVEALHPGLKVWSRDSYFSYRNDYAHWQ